ncbi:hypothetical protein [Thalassobellus suaedae]|uniref:Uncharacterized protein n=1 Tax=Thalassobellus suaedae TaxID=3074124 RepID=A0ABY9XRF2_9FLAO|nr:hypothetical protein RHP51_14745 [Flavobacteriaceae bacterium HL-DH14]
MNGISSISYLQIKTIYIEVDVFFSLEKKGITFRANFKNDMSFLG